MSKKKESRKPKAKRKRTLIDRNFSISLIFLYRRDLLQKKRTVLSFFPSSRDGLLWITRTPNVPSGSSTTLFSNRDFHMPSIGKWKLCVWSLLFPLLLSLPFFSWVSQSHTFTHTSLFEGISICILPLLDDFVCVYFISALHRGHVLRDRPSFLMDETVWKNVVFFSFPLSYPFQTIQFCSYENVVSAISLEIGLLRVSYQSVTAFVSLWRGEVSGSFLLIRHTPPSFRLLQLHSLLKEMIVAHESGTPFDSQHLSFLLQCLPSLISLNSLVLYSILLILSNPNET